MIFSGFSQKSWLWLRSDLFLRVFSASSWSMESPSIKTVPFNHWIGVIGGVLILLLRNSLCYLSSREAVFLRLKVTHLFSGIFFIDRIIYFLNQLYVLIDFLSNVLFYWLTNQIYCCRHQLFHQPILNWKLRGQHQDQNCCHCYLYYCRIFLKYVILCLFLLAFSCFGNLSSLSKDFKISLFLLSISFSHLLDIIFH